MARDGVVVQGRREIKEEPSPLFISVTEGANGAPLATVVVLTLVLLREVPFDSGPTPGRAPTPTQSPPRAGPWAGGGGRGGTVGVGTSRLCASSKAEEKTLSRSRFGTSGVSTGVGRRRVETLGVGSTGPV